MAFYLSFLAILFYKGFLMLKSTIYPKMSYLKNYTANTPISVPYRFRDGVCRITIMMANRRDNGIVPISVWCW